MSDPIEYRRKMTEIKLFVEETPAWYEQIPEELRRNPCNSCGIIPTNVYNLAASVRDIDSEIRERIMRRLNDISYPELMGMISERRRKKFDNITPIEAFKEILIEIIAS